MKRIILVSMFVIASLVQFSCTDDTKETPPSNNKERMVAYDSDPINPTPPIKP